MATRFRLTSDTTAPAVSPALTLAYTHATPPTVRRKLLQYDVSALTVVTYTPDAADHIVAGQSLLCQFVGEPMMPGISFTNGDTIKYVMQVAEPDLGNNMFFQIIVQIVSEDGATLRQLIRTRITHGAEPQVTLTSRFASITQDQATYVTVAGDRLLVEFDFSGTPVAAGGTQGHNNSWRLGGNGTADLAEDSATTTATLNPWVEFTPNIVFVGTVDPHGASGFFGF